MKAGSLARWISTFAVALLLGAQAASAAEVRVMISAGFFGVYSELAAGVRARERAQARDDARPVDGRFAGVHSRAALARRERRTS